MMIRHFSRHATLNISCFHKRNEETAIILINASQYKESCKKTNRFFLTHTLNCWASLCIVFTAFCNCSTWKRATENGWIVQISKAHCSFYLNIFIISHTRHSIIRHIYCCYTFKYWAKVPKYEARLMIYNNSFYFCSNTNFMQQTNFMQLVTYLFFLWCFVDWCLIMKNVWKNGAQDEVEGKTWMFILHGDFSLFWRLSCYVSKPT